MEEEKTHNSDVSEESTSSRIVPRVIEKEMRQSYLDYAMSVIVSRALPDVRDGLKPVHRRILYAMNDMGMLSNKPYKKSARIVGEVLGKYHPHGDSAVYDAMVRMAQDFSLRYTLVNGQGNWGSIDGDRAAAMRYTEARLTKVSEEILQDLDKETVVFVDNFDGSLKEPSVLPSKFPSLLANGASGIAVGMATNIPPHNIKEICQAVISTIENPDIEAKELIDIMPGPDFPTGGAIVGRSGINYAYTHGYGRVRVRAQTDIEKKKDRERIIVKEIPYMVNKSILIEQIAYYVKEKTISDISDIRDESDRDGMRLVLELKKDANPEIVLNQLYKYTRMQTTFGINLLVLENNQPKVMNLKNILTCFIKHRKEVVTNRTAYELRKAEERAHILEGLKIALDNIDQAIRLIKESNSVQLAREGLKSAFSLSDIQAQAILDMKLQKLTSLEQDKIREEYKELQEKIRRLKEILADEQLVYNIIKRETTEIMEKYGDDRKTEILEAEDDIDLEDLIDDEEVVVTITRTGYIKRTPLTVYRIQHRGGKGIKAATTKEEDVIEQLFTASTHDYILLFTAKGKVHWLKVYKLPAGSRQAQGKAIVNIVQIDEGDKVTACIPVKDLNEEKYLFMGTRNGIVKKTPLKAFSRPRQGGIKAIGLPENDVLINVRETDGSQNIILATKKGMAVKFNEEQVRAMGRTAYGVIGIRMRPSDEVIGMVRAYDDKSLLTITKNGYGKRTIISDYRLIHRGGLGVINIKCSDRNGDVVSIKSVEDDDEVMFISKQGIIIRTACGGISKIGRNTQGVRLMRLSSEDLVVAAAKIEPEPVIDDASVEQMEKKKEEKIEREIEKDLEEGL